MTDPLPYSTTPPETMNRPLHRCIADANDVINIVSPVVPLWAVVQFISAYNEDDTAPTPATWSDQILPVHAIGTIPPLSVCNYRECLGAFLVADTYSGVVAWLKRYYDNYTPQKGGEEVYNVFFVDVKPERGKHPCPSSWCCSEYDPTDYVMGIF